MSNRIRPDDIIAAILANHREAASVLLARGMSCIGCAIAPFETLEEVCRAYDVPVERLIEEFEAASAGKEGDA